MLMGMDIKRFAATLIAVVAVVAATGYQAPRAEATPVTPNVIHAGVGQIVAAFTSDALAGVSIPTVVPIVTPPPVVVAKRATPAPKRSAVAATATPAPVVAPVVDPFVTWLANPTFTCDPGYAPGWLDEGGIPTGCVAN